MANSLDFSLTIADLDRAVASVDRGAILAPPRILRRVIKHDRQIGGIGLKVPHRKSYAIETARLLKSVGLDELGLPADAELPERVVLLARPDAEYLASLTAGEALVKYWRLLFHVRVHQALEERIAAEELNAAAMVDRIARIGVGEFEEIRAVLRHEDLLLPPATDLSAYVEFAAVYLELRFFSPSLISRVFPSLGDTDRIDQLLAEELDFDSIWSATRLPDAPDPAPPAGENEPDGWDEDLEAELPATESAPSEAFYRRLNRLAERASAVGNTVRAAIFRTRAARHVRPSLAPRVRAAARDDLRRLAERLRVALDLTDKEARRWSEPLIALLARSVRGFWTRESRTLYDLQKACLDFEREIFTFDLVEWALSRGRVPIKRALPGQREALMSKHLRVARRRAEKARIDDRSRRRLTQLLDAAVMRAERKLRERFRPLIAAALDAVGLRAANVPERIARLKVIEELLDQVVERNFLTMSDLRDAISRNNLKLPDLQGVGQFFSGDQLLEADRKLAESLDGVYHRGEVYLRLPQRLSSLAFGTPLGRVLVRYLAIPYGGAFLLIEGAKHLALLIMLGFGARRAVETGSAPVPEPELMSKDTMHLAVMLLGTFLLALIYSQRFRRAGSQVLHGAWRAGRWLATELPVWLTRIPFIRRLLESPLYLLAASYVVKPLTFTVLILAAFRSLATTWPAALRNGGMIFCVVNLTINSRVGRNAEEVVTDWTVRTWDRFRLRVLGALVQMVMEFFNDVVDAVDRFLYSVDEWLRFRSGQSGPAVAIKALLGVVWFFISYVVRFCISLLIEPQINPVKHFPVVTVSHKVLISLSPTLYGITFERIEHLVGGPVTAKTIFGAAIFLLPGVVGFLVWELKENWRLYKANRPRVLQGVQVGRHGENVARLLRLGFHSGTLPKLQARLRRADRKAHWSGNWKRSRKYAEKLREVEHEMRRFVERDLVALLRESRRFQPLELRLGRVDLGVNNIRFELVCPEIADVPLRLSLEDQAGWLAARILDTGWTTRLADSPRQALADALTGFYKMSGIELVHEQIEAVLGAGVRYQINDRGLALCGPTGEIERQIDLRDDEHPHPATDYPVSRPAAFEREQLLFAGSPVSWELWVEVWDRDQAGGRHTPRLVLGPLLLPDAVRRAVS